MAQVLWSSAPSGAAAVVRARGAILGLASHLANTWGVPSLCSVSHVSKWDGCIAGPNIYVGQGFVDVQNRPSAYANPFFFLNDNPVEAVVDFTKYLARRADKRWFLRPLYGRVLVCDCGRPDACHANVLKDEIAAMVADEATVSAETAKPTGAIEHWESLRTELAEHEANDSDGEAGPLPPAAAKEERQRVNETVRGGKASLDGERVGWPAAWLLLVTVVRAATAPLFWEVFSGEAGLSNAFAAAGWGIAPPHRYRPRAGF